MNNNYIEVNNPRSPKDIQYINIDELNNIPDKLKVENLRKLLENVEIVPHVNKDSN